MAPALTVTSGKNPTINDAANLQTLHDFDEDLQQMTGEAVGLDLHPANYIVRAAGSIIDLVASVILASALLLVLNLDAIRALLDTSTTTALTISIIVFATVVAPTAVETATHGKSLGRLAIGARIVRNDGGAIGFRHAFIRALTALIEIYGTLGGGAAITGLLNAKSQRIGDLLAGTYCQNERIRHPQRQLYGIPTELAQWATTADVARMPDALSRRISQFLSQAARLSPSARSRLAAELARESSAYVSPLPQADSELFLAAVRVLRRQRELRALHIRAAQLKRLEPVLTALPHGFPER